MGRGSKQGQQQGQPWNSGGYRVWPGAYSPHGGSGVKDKQRPWNQGTQRAEPVFPTYASVNLPADRPNAALNVTRKAEQKVLKLREAHKAAGVKWSEFEAKMKEAFRRERSRFSRDLERLGKEILEAEEAQEIARMGLRAAFCGESQLPSHSNGDADMSGGPDVEEVFAEWAREDSSATDAMVRRALGASLVTPTRPTAAAPRTPLQDRASVPPGLSTADPGVAAFDPYSYVPSPAAIPPGNGFSGNASQPPMVRPIVERPAIAPTPPPAEPPPGPDTMQESYGKSPSLQERLLRRRALEPFGTGRHAQTHAGGAVTSAPDTMANLHGGLGSHPVRIVNDDDEFSGQEAVHHPG
ncbi:unnamed protein product [Symbiodinium sp. CCMP2456]|nr:unnamed protein product [Symbiodinium sp. CCMP2456]